PMISVVDLETLALTAPIPIEGGRPFGLAVADCPRSTSSPLPTQTPTPSIVCDPHWIACNPLWFTCHADGDCTIADGLDCCTCIMGGGPQVAINQGRQSEVDSLRRVLCDGVACPAIVTCQANLKPVCRAGLCALEGGVVPTPSPTPSESG